MAQEAGIGWFRVEGVGGRSETHTLPLWFVIMAFCNKYHISLPLKTESGGQKLSIATTAKVYKLKTLMATKTRIGSSFPVGRCQIFSNRCPIRHYNMKGTYNSCDQVVGNRKISLLHTPILFSNVIQLHLINLTVKSSLASKQNLKKGF